ncbi:sirohydrochlorin chelatase [Paraliobacillus sp. JSM ZJ581]
MKVVIYVAHGSKKEPTNQQFVKAIKSMIEINNAARKKIAFLEANPALDQTIDQCKQEGATQVIVVPIFLLPGMHVTRDIPNILQQKNRQYPSLSFYYAPAFNKAKEIVEDTYNRIKNTQALRTGYQQQAVLVISHGSKNTQASHIFQDFCKALAHKLANIPVYQAYLKSTTPTIEEQIKKLQEQNDATIIVVPHFFAMTMFPKIIENKIIDMTSKQLVFVKGIAFNNTMKQLMGKQIELAKKID